MTSKHVLIHLVTLQVTLVLEINVGHRFHTIVVLHLSDVVALLKKYNQRP